MKVNRHGLIISILLFILFLPILGTALYSMTTSWSGTLLPNGINGKWYVEALRNPILINSILRTIYVCAISLIIISFVMIPTIFIINYYFPKLEKIMEVLVLVCFSVPGAVSVVGIMKMYSSGILKITGTLYILVGVYFVIAFPFMYRGIKNNMSGLPMREIIESANILGVSTWKAFIYLIIPNIRKGIIISTLLVFSILFGEFLLVNMLVGGRYQTIQMYINSIRTGVSGHYSSAVVTIYFLMIFLITFLGFGLQKEKGDN